MTISFTRLMQLGLLALPLGFAAAPASATSGRTFATDVASAPLTEQVQYYRGRERRCWTEVRRVRFQDRFGRIVVRERPVRICR
ncbi:hypothetical protein [Plastoroseomonas arctica]|uniref:Secreted protein n=1 Tax=Plastoroseomonas arctica TaxID=1509237 RepID=A0AAF1KRU4_9PROT|nr:hypothetical protein [Plastoroseomonas arctica]MBR0654732.1 hypothetical protein [Plastoroseomonas arctica]